MAVLVVGRRRGREGRKWDAGGQIGGEQGREGAGGTPVQWTWRNPGNILESVEAGEGREGSEPCWCPGLLET